MDAISATMRTSVSWILLKEKTRLSSPDILAQNLETVVLDGIAVPEDSRDGQIWLGHETNPAKKVSSWSLCIEC